MMGVLRKIFPTKFKKERPVIGQLILGTTSSYEIVNFEEPIGYAVNKENKEKISTTWGVIHYASDGYHIVPAWPKRGVLENFSMSYLLASAKVALTGVITPELRAVIVDVDNEDLVLYMRFYYAGEVSEKVLDQWACAISETRADFGPYYDLDAAVERIDYPKEMPFRGQYAYLRSWE